MTWKEVRAASNAVRLARSVEDGHGVLIERDRHGDWVTVEVGRGDAARCEQHPTNT